MKRGMVAAAVAVALIVPLFPAEAQDAADDWATLEAEGRAAVTAGDWETALGVYEALSAADPESVVYLSGYARALGHLEDPEGSLAAYRRILELDGTNVAALSGAAVMLGRLGRVEEAFESLTAAAENGLTAEVMRASPAFAGLRESKQRFAIAVGVAVRTANPCTVGGAYDDFDFWLGEWDVYVGGRKTARSVITRELNGCLVREAFSDASGYQGESYNYYDPEFERWMQNWVDTKGGVVRYSGAVARYGVMRMEGTNTDARGATLLSRVTWSAESDGTVLHVIETSDDDGETWSPFFEGVYVRAGQTPPR